jgi:hypothetical protein
MKVEIKSWEVEVNEETMNALYEAYSAATANDIHSNTEEAHAARMALENALVAMGLLEADQEPEGEEEETLDYTNDAQHWDEYVADLKYDQYRDMVLMGYEV